MIRLRIWAILLANDSDGLGGNSCCNTSLPTLPPYLLLLLAPLQAWTVKMNMMMASVSVVVVRGVLPRFAVHIA